MDKISLRQKCLKKRAGVAQKEKKSISICKEILSLDAYKNNHIIAAYWAKEDEVDLSLFIKTAIKDRKLLLLPKIVGQKIKFYIYRSGDTLVESSFHIMEPVGEDQYYINNKDIELFIVPGLAFDKNGNRLGYGKGYYDKILKISKGYTIGVAFKEMIFDNIPHDENDVPVDLIISK